MFPFITNRHHLLPQLPFILGKGDKWIGFDQIWSVCEVLPDFTRQSCSYLKTPLTSANVHSDAWHFRVSFSVFLEVIYRKVSVTCTRSTIMCPVWWLLEFLLFLKIIFCTYNKPNRWLINLPIVNMPLSRPTNRLFAILVTVLILNRTVRALGSEPLEDMLGLENSLSVRRQPMLLNKALGFLLQRKRSSCCSCTNCNNQMSSHKDADLNGKTRMTSFAKILFLK